MKSRRFFEYLSILTSILLFVTAMAVAGVANRALADFNPDKPNDATQGRVRINQCIGVVPRANVYINGKQVVNGGVPQSVGATETSGYVYLAPGSYSVALVRDGGSIDHPFFGPVNVQVTAGHRFTVVVLGQSNDQTHEALVIDETSAYAAIGATLPDNKHIGHITVNNLKGAPPIYFVLGGVQQEKGVAYGQFEAAQWPAYAKGIAIGSGGQTGPGDDGDIINPPGEDNMDCLFGVYPGGDTHTTVGTSLLNTVDYLKQFGEFNATTGGQTPTFNTYLAALKSTGLEDAVVNAGPHMIFAPTDEAFASLSKEQRDALLSNPRMLADTLRANMVEGYYPFGSLGIGGFDRTVKNMLGDDLVLSGEDELRVNGVPVAGGDDLLMIANGTRLFWASRLLIPDSAIVATPTTGSANPQPTIQIPGTNSRTFSETGKTVSGLFLDYWQKNGGLAQQGYPISNPLLEKSPLDGKTYTVQYFERAVFEYHPENADPYNVLLSQLGNFQYKNKYGEAGAPNQTPNTSAGSMLFAETGHRVGGKFLDYWQKNGGLAQQGYPISDEFQEKSDLDGKTYMVQYFERAVFESHPENASPYDVLLSQLGTFRYKETSQNP